MAGAATSPRLFVSYSHDSAAHRERVLGLVQRLRLDGFDAELDQFVEGTPLQGWPRWMLDQLDRAESVLMVCTEQYYRRFRGHERPGLGRGVGWEGAVITQEIYDRSCKTKKFVPVLFDRDHFSFVPEPVRGHTAYVLTSEAEYQALCRFLAGSAGVEPVALGPFQRPARLTGTPLRFDDPGAEGLPAARDTNRPQSEQASGGQDAVKSAPVDAVSDIERVELVGELDGRAFALTTDRVAIGRSTACDIQLAHAFVSPFHAQLVRLESGYAIEDLGSANGVYVNGQRVPHGIRRPLVDGDRIHIGQSILLYHANRSSEAVRG